MLVVVQEVVSVQMELGALLAVALVDATPFAVRAKEDAANQYHPGRTMVGDQVVLAKNKTSFFRSVRPTLSMNSLMTSLATSIHPIQYAPLFFACRKHF
jgi:hypothetical protein